MAKLLGIIEYKNNDQLEEVLNGVGYSCDIDKEDYEYFDADALWSEAEDEFDDGGDQAECRITGLDYVLIEK